MHRGKPFHVDFCRFALPLLYALNEADAAFRVKLRQQLPGLDMTAAEILLYLVDGVVDVYPSLIVEPFVFQRKSHAVKQQTV